MCGRSPKTTRNTPLEVRKFEGCLVCYHGLRKGNYIRVRVPSRSICYSFLTCCAASAPKPFARHIVISAQPVLPTPEATSEPPTFKSIPREQHPRELLKHKFMPYGSKIRENQHVGFGNSVEEDAILGSPSKREAKKRKAEGTSPRKSKKTKIVMD